MIIIHPKDSTTDFLAKIYRGLSHSYFFNAEHIIFYGLFFKHKSSELRRVLNHKCSENERIYLLGHGTENGLLSNVNNRIHYIINSKHVEFLRKLECVGIWCNANMFAEKYNLKGLFSGMIISEMDEAYMYGIDTTHEELEEENQKFAERLRYCLDNYPLNEIPIRMLELDDKRSQLTTFNYQNLYWYE